jgi:hypothetical protein
MQGTQGPTGHRVRNFAFHQLYVWSKRFGHSGPSCSCRASISGLRAKPTSIKMAQKDQHIVIRTQLYIELHPRCSKCALLRIFMSKPRSSVCSLPSSSLVRPRHECSAKSYPPLGVLASIPQSTPFLWIHAIQEVDCFTIVPPLIKIRFSLGLHHTNIVLRRPSGLRGQRQTNIFLIAWLEKTPICGDNDGKMGEKKQEV